MGEIKIHLIQKKIEKENKEHMGQIETNGKMVYLNSTI